MPDGSALKIIPLFGRDYQSKSSAVTRQWLINLYREMQADPDKASMVLFGTPGLSMLPGAFGINIDWIAGLSLNSIPGFAGTTIRGARVVANTLWLVIGNLVIACNSGGASSAPSNFLVTSSGRVSMSDNGNQLIIVDGTAGYTIALNLADGSSSVGGAFLNPYIIKIVSASFPNGASTVTFLNGYFIVDNPAGSRPGQFNWSALYDGTTWSALDFANAESNPDPLIHVLANFGQLFLFGPLTTEVWAPSGDSAIFRRVGGAGIEWGLAAKWCVDKFENNSLVFLAKNKLGQCQPARIDGYTVTPLGVGPTDPEITNAINNGRNVGSATCYTYSLDAHSFYQVNFVDASFLYDTQTQSWSQLQSGGGRHYGEIRFEYNSIPYVTDYRNGRCYLVSATVYTDNGDPIIREIVTKHAFADYNRLTVAELYVDMETGVGLQTGQGQLPQIMASWSHDGGYTFGNEIWQTFGAVGQFVARATWRCLGRFRDFVFRFRISDPVKVVIVNAAVRVA